MKSFEERLGRLEQLSEKLRAGSLPLEEAVDVFEEGIRLARDLEKELTRIERRVEILIADRSEDQDKPTLELFPEIDETGEDGGG